MTRALDSAAEELADADSDQAQRDLQKIRRLQSVYSQFETLVNVFTSQSTERVMRMVKKLRS